MQKKRPIIISLAPIGEWKQAGVQSPYSADEVAREVQECEARGAALVHLHVRDENGAATTDMRVFNETAAEIRSHSSLILQGSTGGVEGLSAADRCVVLQNDAVEMASLNMGSTNFFNGVYVNSPGDIRYWADRMNQRNIVPELELFSLSMIPASILLQEEGLLKPPLRFSLCMGIPGAIPLDPRFLCMAAQLMPADAVWGIMLHGRMDPGLVAAALSLGASWVRVGYEDSPYNVSGRTAGSNAELVQCLQEYLELQGYRIADAAEARELLCLDT